MPKEKKVTGGRKKAEKRQKDALVARSDSPKRKRASPSSDEAVISTPGNNTFDPSEVSAAAEDENTPLNDTDSLAKHPSILRKFQALLRSKPSTQSANDAQVPKPVILPDELRPQGLQPLPQPLSTKRTKSQIPLDSTLPPWLSQPTVVLPDYSILFTDLPLSTKLQNRIASHLKFERAFAVQAAVLPLLLAGPMDPNYHTYYDVLVSAPTGSGKTLSYVLPVIQNLSQRTITRLRAVIIVPTRELVSQVRDTIDSLASGLKVGIAWGARSLDFERTLLVKDHWEADIGRPDIFDDQYGDDVRYSSKVDVLICTPGRLVEHLKTTPGFNFKDLKWMVIDEADRLLAQSFQEWLGAVSKALHLESSQFDTKTHEFINTLGMRKNEHEGVRKIILSATMTKDAGKLAGLKLRRPKLVVIEHEAVEKTSNEDKKLADVPMIDQQEETDEDDKPDEIFSVPSTLSEHYIAVGDIEDKPLYLVQLLQLQGIRSGVLVFTKSNESAARLARLMDLMVEGLKVGLVSGELNKAGRKKTLAEFKRNEIDILVCSDLISRGMDLPAVDHVINYDSSSSTSSYVHRVGRTARAGNEGDAWSLVATNEARWFWRNVGRGIKRGGKTVERVPIDFAVDRAARERYESALRRLGVEVKARRN